MTISSMTGFARSEGQFGALSWIWEVKSVNGRALDIRCRLPSGMDCLEPRLRQTLSGKLKRGHVNVSLQVKRSARDTTVRINHAILGELVAAARALGDETGVAPPRLDGLLRLAGVTELVEEDESDDEREARETAMIAGFAEAADALAEARRAEGAGLGAIIAGHITELANLSARARQSAALEPALIRQNLEKRVAEILDVADISPERLAQEVAILVAKADVREEIDRLEAHVEAARELVAKGGALGRRLDFLAQELTREANTLCSKASDLALTRIGLDMKATIDQLREQVQNIE